MNIRVSEPEGNLNIAQSYYNAMLAKDFDKMDSYLHKEVHFAGPLSEMCGKDAVISAAKHLSQVLQDIEIRSKFAVDNKIMFAYDFIFPHPINRLRAAVLMEFTKGLISKIELFFDSKPFIKE